MKHIAKTAVILSALCAQPSLAEDYALLIGASTYPNLDERFWLKGPANDVALVKTFLTTNISKKFEPSNITVLADGLQDYAAPTLDAIRRAFGEIAQKAQQGDFVYLHFSGHGSQAPALNPDQEQDGLDEMFLPVDVGPWDDTVGTVSNALIDDEIGALIDSIRVKGADVWVVFDSCHSGTATRAVGGVSDETRLRKLDPSVLGVPDIKMVEAETQSRALPNPRERLQEPVEVSDATEGMGRLTAFFAAQTNETTPEKRLPKGDVNRVSQGVFTYSLFETLAERPNITYRQLGQEILRKYGVKNLARSTPLFEGDLDVAVFGNTDKDITLQWPVKIDADKITISAGNLHGLESGAELLLLASAADLSEDALGSVEIISSSTFDSKLAKSADLAEIPKGSYIRKIGISVDFNLTVSVPDGDTSTISALNTAIDVIGKYDLVGPRIKFVANNEEADIRLTIVPEHDGGDAIWMFPSSGYVDDIQLDSTPRISTNDKSAQELAEAISDNLQRISKALNLLKVSQDAESSDLPVLADFNASRFDPDAQEVIEGTKIQIDAIKTPLMLPNDVVGVDMTNDANYPVDYNVLYIGSDYSITHMDNGRLQPGDRLDEDFVLISDKTFGRDRMLVFLTPADEQSAVEDLSFLEQDEVPTKRGGENSEMFGLLAEAGFGQTTRGAVSLKKKTKKNDPKSRVYRLEIDTIPE